MLRSIRTLVLLMAVAARVLAADPLGLARAGRYGDLASMGTAALPPLLDAYPTADRETKSAILLALGALDVKSPAATTVLRTDVDGEDSAFQDLHRYALQVVDPAVRSTNLFEQVTDEGIALDPALGSFMYATLLTAYDACAERLGRARHWVDDLADDDPKTRYAAIVSLRIMTGATHAYHPWAADGARAQPLAAWHAWLRRLERSCHA